MSDAVPIDGGPWGTAMRPGRWRGTGPALFTLAVAPLFGFNEIFTYSRKRNAGAEKKRG